MRARGIAGRHKMREPGREDEDPLVAMDYVMARTKMTTMNTIKSQNKTSHPVVKDVKTGTCAGTFLREKGASEYGTAWMVSLLRRLGDRRAILQSDGKPSTAALKTATLLADPLVELVLRESPVGEYPTDGVAASAMREVKRQTRVLKFAVEAHTGKIGEAHPILKWMPTVAADAIRFFRNGRDGLPAEVLRSGRSWKKLVEDFGKPVFFLPATATAVRSARCSRNCTCDGSLGTTHALAAFSS